MATEPSGVISRTGGSLATISGDPSIYFHGDLSFAAYRVVPTARENRPVNTAIPVSLYLGEQS